jgi:hypothetical protein
MNRYFFLVSQTTQHNGINILHKNVSYLLSKMTPLDDIRVSPTIGRLTVTVPRDWMHMLQRKIVTMMSAKVSTKDMNWNLRQTCRNIGQDSRWATVIRTINQRQFIPVFQSSLEACCRYLYLAFGLYDLSVDGIVDLFLDMIIACEAHHVNTPSTRQTTTGIFRRLANRFTNLYSAEIKELEWRDDY